MNADKHNWILANKRRRWGCLLLIAHSLLVWCGTGMSQEVEVENLPVTSRGELGFMMGLSAFRGPEGFARQEVHLLLDAQQLTFVSRQGQILGEMALVAAVVDTAGDRVADQTWVRPVSVADRSQPWRGVPFREVIWFDLKPGRYRVFLNVRDIHGKKKGRCEAALYVPDFERPGLAFSDLQLATSLERSGEAGRFVKQGWKVVPNTSRYYVSGEPLAVYFELYNFAVDADRAEDSFILGYNLMDSAGQVVKQFPAKRYLKPGESAVKAEFLGTEGLPEGTYRVQVEAYDGSKGENVRIAQTFSLVSGLAPEGLTQVQEDMLTYYADIRYVADPEALKTYQGLQDWLAKSTFLRAFWKELDPTPNTPANEQLMDHILKMTYADARFESEPGKRGANTDKGRVYILYGPPDDIDYHTSAAGERPFEVWIYHQPARYEFVFRDQRGLGIYELVHSTHSGEIQNPYWRQEF